ncbi:2Fe-2S ferredoxin-like protein [Alteromonadaceae bacterium M269]|nr:2Fe-2S ferredoxin-like protein [Alteromonadaceae bacterium M269]
MNKDRYQVLVSGKEIAIKQEPDKTLLENLEDNKVEIHSHCREGFCGTCRTRLISGEVDYIIDPLAYIDDDEILPCCCKAVSDITIEIN